MIRKLLEEIAFSINCFSRNLGAELVSLSKVPFGLVRHVPQQLMLWDSQADRVALESFINRSYSERTGLPSIAPAKYKLALVWPLLLELELLLKQNHLLSLSARF